MLLWETVGSVLWFLMDACWMLDWKLAASALVIPCVTANLMVFPYTPRLPAILAVTAAMNCWLAMNVGWMLDDLWDIPSLMTAARVFLVMGLALLLAAFAASRWRPETRAAVLAGFRRLRIQLPRRPGGRDQG